MPNMERKTKVPANIIISTWFGGTNRKKKKKSVVFNSVLFFTYVHPQNSSEISHIPDQIRSDPVSEKIGREGSALSPSTPPRT